MHVKDKVTVVTGGAQGIGLGLCTRFAKEGAQVVLSDLSQEKCESAAATNGAFPVAADVGHEDDIEHLVEATVERFGRIDLFVSNAGIAVDDGLETPNDKWRKPRGVHLMTTPHLSDPVPTYLSKGDPAGRFESYYPTWVESLADDVTLEGSMLDGAVQGADAVRTLIGGARLLYDRQDFNFVGPWGDNGFIEDYTAEVHGEPLGAVHLITFNSEGKAQSIVANYRPLSSVMLFSRLLRKKFAGTPYAQHFLAGDAEANAVSREETVA